MSEVRCKTCRFFVTGTVMGACRRFPEMQNKHEMDWCGEHDKLYMVQVPVYDIMTDETKAVEMPRKKPGRKPKNVSDTPAT